MRFALAALLLVAASPAWAGDPATARPARYTIWSHNGRFCADLDPARAETTVFFVDEQGDRRALWSVDGWFRVASLADDGEHLVVGSDRFGLVPLDYDPGDAVLRIFRRGHLQHAIALSQVVPDPLDLLRTTSFYDWGRYDGFDEHGRYVLERVDGTLVTVDVASGAVASLP